MSLLPAVLSSTLHNDRTEMPSRNVLLLFNCSREYPLTFSFKNFSKFMTPFYLAFTVLSLSLKPGHSPRKTCASFYCWHNIFAV